LKRYLLQSMLTIFTLPKPFTGHSAIIQRNAINSWLKLKPTCEIILCGNDYGIAETAAELYVKHEPSVETNEYGTPLLSSAFQVIKEKASNSLLCYVNADIIITQSLIDAVRQVNFKEYLLVGQRWNLDIDEALDYEHPGWEKQLLEKVDLEGKIQPPFGSDYFIFPKEVNWEIPDFAVGRPGWDNWLIFRARALKIQVVDATLVGTVVHQNHNYAHIKDSLNPNSFEGPEAEKNRNLMGNGDTSFNIGDATYLVTTAGVCKAKDYKYLKYRVIRQPVLQPAKGFIQKSLWRFFQALLYRRNYFPEWFWQNLIYTFTK